MAFGGALAGGVVKIGIQVYGDLGILNRAFKQGKLRKAVNKAKTSALAAWAKKAAKNIKGALRDGSFPSLSSATVFLKGHNVPLWETGQLYNSIKAIKLPDNSWFGGVDPKMRHPTAGMTVADLALIQQRGASIAVTSSMRMYLRGRGLRIGDDTDILVIPPRTFVAQGVGRTMADASIVARDISTSLIRSVR
jgi:hypothetical protein